MGTVLHESDAVRVVRHPVASVVVHDRTPDGSLHAALRASRPTTMITPAAAYYACLPANRDIPGDGVEAKVAHVVELAKALEPRPPERVYPLAMAPEGGLLAEPAPGVTARRAGRDVHLSGPGVEAVLPPGARRVPRHALGPGALVPRAAYEALRSSS